MKNIHLLFASVLLCCTSMSMVSCAQTGQSQKDLPASDDPSLVWDGTRIEKTEEEWKQELEPFQFYVMREKGTERAFSGSLNDNKKDGIYSCSACGLPLFDAATKFDSGSGWPSFYQPIDPKNVGEDTDYDIGYPRTEVRCARCDGHLGHVFNDGIGQPTGLRYCINSASLEFEAR